MSPVTVRMRTLQTVENRLKVFAEKVEGINNSRPTSPKRGGWKEKGGKGWPLRSTHRSIEYSTNN